MSGLGSLLSYLRDPKLAAHATSALPAWLWSVDATQVLWANPAAAAIFDAASPAALAGHVIDPKGSAALQIARVAVTLPQGAAPRLERLRGFGASFGRALMCACSRVILEDRTPAVLVVAAEAAGAGLPLTERVRRLCVGIEVPIAFFSTDGELMHATTAGQARLLGLKSIAALGAETLAGEALASGRAAGASHLGPVSVERIGADASTVLLVTFSQASAQAKPVAHDAAPVVQDLPQPSAVPTPAEPKSSVQLQPAATEPKLPPASAERRQRMRFVWQMDADGRLTIDSDEFVALIGPQSVAMLGRPWREIATELDPDGQIVRAIASHDTWSGITVAFPVDDIEQHLQVELSGLPVFDRERNFGGYRGFGICRDAAQVAALAHLQRAAKSAPPGPKGQAGALKPNAAEAEVPAELKSEVRPAKPTFEPRAEPPAIRQERPMLTVVPPVENVLPFRASEPNEKSPSLTPVERKAFRELASKLTARLREAQTGALSGAPPLDLDVAEPPEPLAEPPPAKIVPTAPESAGRAMGGDQRPILDRLPLGVLVYRLDRLLYANRAFLDWTGYDSIHALADAGGLDALFIEPGTDTPGQNGTKSLSITTSHGSQVPIEARLFSTPWDGESALVLMLAGTAAEDRGKPASADKAQGVAETEARELRSILDTATDGVVLLDREGRVISINRSAEMLFGYQSRELSGLPFAGLFAPESQRIAFDCLDRVNRSGAAGVLDEGREVIGRGRERATIPLFMTVGQVSGGTDKLVAVFRNLAAWKKAEENLLSAKQQAERASSAKSDFLAKISHEIRTPLNAIIGFSEVMMEERFGPVGNERYKQYLKDIHTSGEHLISLLNDLLDLSKIEAGKLDLNFAALDLNELTQQCVALMQPQANRGRIIIRTALSSALPTVLADARSVRQIALNLLSNSIKFTGAGGQVIVSTALNDSGEVVLRVRDTGAGMSEKEIAIALEPFRQLATSVRFGSGGTGLGLPLTKALAEANRATFSIKSTVNAGTLIEVAFPGTPLAAE
jgi:PAS domain S-box-containing protein